MRIEHLGLFSRNDSTSSADRFRERTQDLPIRRTSTGISGKIFLAAAESGMSLAEHENICLLLRGHAVSRDVKELWSRPRMAKWLLNEYRATGDLKSASLDGSFSVVLVDTGIGKVLMYRNIVGTASIYYAASQEELYWGSNLANLQDAMPIDSKPNEAVLPGFFIGRCVTGKRTLFEDIYRVQPGEMVCHDQRGLQAEQRETLGGLGGKAIYGDDAMGRVEKIFNRVLSEHASDNPYAVNLLSGGVDSSFIQACWNQAASSHQGKPRSVAITVNHEMTEHDRQYARSAAESLNTDHQEIACDAPVAELITESIRVTGEPPNHVQTAYFVPLARALFGSGTRAALCGEGADALFGNDSINILHRAQTIHDKLPQKLACQSLAVLAKGMGRPFFAKACQLAPYLEQFEYSEHPVNQAGAFADWTAIGENFGDALVEQARCERRLALDQYEVSDEPFDAAHAASLLHEALGTATLWTTCCNAEGVDLICPFLDSRVIGTALRCDPALRFSPNPLKYILRKLLAQHVPDEIAYRKKLGFAQPIFEWLMPGGQLAPLTTGLENHAFLQHEVLAKSRKNPSWFLYTALCYDIWHKSFFAG